MRPLLLTALLLLTTLSLTAQKYGHVNFGNLLSEMPEVATAEKSLQDFEKERTAVGEKMVEELRATVLEVQENEDNITPKQMAVYKKEIAAKQNEIRQFEQQLARAIEAKRQELLGPIIQRAKDAVEAVAKAEGYDLVFDSSIFGNLLFADETTDLLPLVRARLE